MKKIGKYYLNIRTTQNAVPVCIMWFFIGMVLGWLYSEFFISTVQVIFAILFTYGVSRIVEIYKITGTYENRFATKRYKTIIYTNVLTRNTYIMKETIEEGKNVKSL